MAKVSPASVYSIERWSGRTRTLITLAKALGLTLRLPDLRALAADRGFTDVRLADAAGLAFDSVRSLLARPLSGNVKSLEKLCAALGCRPQLVL
jgi:DNA-binding Xre family transcriptional regulator